MKISSYLSLLFLTFFLTACGGGSSSPSSDNKEPPQNPGDQGPSTSDVFDSFVIQAADASVVGGEEFTLEILESPAYKSAKWRQTSGPAITVISDNARTFRIKAPYVDSDTVLTFEIEITSASGQKKQKEVRVTVTPDAFAEVTLEAIQDRVVEGGDNVDLRGPASSSITQSEWSQIRGVVIEPASNDSEYYQFKAPYVEVATDFQFTLQITSEDGRTKLKTVTVTVTPDAFSRINFETVQVEATTGGGNVSLYGPSSSSIERSEWSQISGAAIELTSNSSQNIRFKAPYVEAATNFQFTLQISSEDGRTKLRTITVTVTPDSFSRINFEDIQDKTATGGESVGLFGPNFSSIKRYEWSQTSGAEVELPNKNNRYIFYKAPYVEVTTDFEFRLKITSADGRIKLKTVIVTVNPDAFTLFQLDAGDDQIVTAGDDVSLAYELPINILARRVAWTHVSGVEVNPNFGYERLEYTAPSVVQPTAAVFELSVTSHDGRIKKDQVTVTINPFVNRIEMPVTIDVYHQNSVSLDREDVLTYILDPTESAYSWQQLSGPESIIDVRREKYDDGDHAYSHRLSFEFPELDNRAEYTYRLTVNTLRGPIHQDILIRVHPAYRITGEVSFDHIPHTDDGALDFTNIEKTLLKRAEVQLIDELGNTVESSKVIDGAYSFGSLKLNKKVKVRLLAKTTKTSSWGWNVSVVDNTNEGALYVLESEFFDVNFGQQNLIQNIHAASGWDVATSSYASPRAAAPFHILHNAAVMIDKIHDADFTVVFPELKINWSINNKPISGEENITIGHIGTSFYRTEGDTKLANLYLLGDKTTDTDEFDGQVILHELGHYFEDKLSRSDSIGGSHGSGDFLDPRVAFSEGFGNAWAGMISNDAIYADSGTNAQGVSVGSIRMDMENDQPVQSGWWNEETVQSVLFDAFDDNSLPGSDTDELHADWRDIIRALKGDGSQKDTAAFTTIYSFSKALKDELYGNDELDWDGLLTSNSIDSSLNEFGPVNANYTVNGTELTYSMHHQLELGISKTNICTDNSYGKYNKVFNRIFATFNTTEAGTYQVEVSSRGDNASHVDPDIVLQNRDNTWRFEEEVSAAVIAAPATTTGNSEVGQVLLEAGANRVEFFDYSSFQSSPNDPIRSCFDITVSKI